jgi:N-acetylated-alpha-linked acidic dipeptidase
MVDSPLVAGEVFDPFVDLTICALNTETIGLGPAVSNFSLRHPVATGDASLFEMARVIASDKDKLRCGVRFCWWPGHSTGRYSGSTWYVDNYFNYLRDHALGHLNIDSPGVRDAEIWDCRYNMGEIEHITSAVVRELSGQEPNIRRPLRAGDQSFLGAGLP